jgi:hypothetical protein
MAMDRRRMLAATAAAGLGLIAVPRPVLAKPPVPRLEFEVHREGSPIGHHHLRLHIATDGSTAVEIDIDLAVKFGFLTLYRYTHRNRELWDGEQLLTLDSTTDDNGERHQVAVRREGATLWLDAGRGREAIPGDVQTTSYWDRRMVLAGEWLDTQNGRLVRSAVTPAGSETIRAGGRLVRADRFDLNGDLTLSIWYAGPVWVRLAFQAQADGSRIEYHLRTPLPGSVA